MLPAPSLGRAAVSAAVSAGRRRFSTRPPGRAAPGARTGDTAGRYGAQRKWQRPGSGSAAPGNQAKQTRREEALAARIQPAGKSDPVRLRELVAGTGGQGLRGGGPAAEGRLERVRYHAPSDRLHLTFAGVGQPLAVSPLWLRDACPCPRCVTPSSGQKQVQTFELPARPRIRRAAVDAVGSEGGETTTTALRVVWEDEGGEGEGPEEHHSVFDAKALLYRLAGMAPPAYPVLPGRRLWDRPTLAQALRPVAFADWMAPDDGTNAEFYRGLRDLHQLGLLVVDGVPDGDETAVRAIARQIGHVQTTLYGELFDVVSKPDAENVAYTNVFLGLHQDLLYLRDPPHIQLLHCLRNDCAGGESLFADSVRAAVEMLLRHPRDARALAALPVRYHYERNGHHYFYSRPVIELEPRSTHAAVKQTGWSPPFQDVFPRTVDLVTEIPPGASDGLGLPGSDTQETDAASLSSVAPPDDYARHLARWHSAARVFAALLEHPDNQFEFKLQPGQCVLFHNRRVLHGRRQFDTGQSGSRWLKGAYIDEQTFTSRVIDMVRRGRHLAPGQDPADVPQLPRFPLLPTEQHASDVAQVERMFHQRISDDIARRRAAGLPKDWGARS